MPSARWLVYKEQLAQRGAPDVERLRTALRFVVCTVHNSVKVSENEFERYHYHGILPKTLPTRRARALADVETLCDSLDWDTFSALPLPDKLDYIVSRVFGLGYAKTAFALDFAMVHNVACIDIWAARKRLETDRAPNWRDARHYLSVVKSIYGRVDGSGTRQWLDFTLWNRAFRRTSHAVVFRAMGVDVDHQLAFNISAPFARAEGSLS